MKKLSSLISLLILLSMGAFAQNPFSYGLLVNFERGSLSTPKFNEAILNAGFYQTGKVGYSVGAYTQYDFESRLFLRAGINLEASNYEYGFGGIIFPTQISPQELLIERGRVKQTRSLMFVTIPIDVGLRIPTKDEQIHFLMGIGGSLNFFVNSYGTETYYEPTDIVRASFLDKDDINSSAYSLSIFTGVEIGLSDKLNVTIEPQLKYLPNALITSFNQAEVKSAFEPGVNLRMRFK